MFDAAQTVYAKALGDIQEAGLWKEERKLTTPQGAVIRTTAGQEVSAQRSEGTLPAIAAAARSLAAPRAADRVVDVALRLVDGARRSVIAA